jgi:peptide-methionine (S)-S-oxide reductase
MQDLFRHHDGVISTPVGYTGGDVPNATYRNHGTHAEAIEIIFDPSKISYRKLLEFFFHIHDPTTRNRQGGDVGTSYCSAIFYTTDERKRIAEDTIRDIDASGQKQPPARTARSSVIIVLHLIELDFPAPCDRDGYCPAR